MSGRPALLAAALGVAGVAYALLSLLPAGSTVGVPRLAPSAPALRANPELAFAPAEGGGYVGRARGGTVAVRADGVDVALRGERAPRGERAAPGPRFGLRLAGADPDARLRPEGTLPGTVSHLVGPRDRWRAGLPTFARVVAESVYPGIDAVYYGNDRELEYDLVVAPGADPGQVRLAFEGAAPERVDAAGDLLLEVQGRTVIQRRPIAFQEAAEGRVAVAAAYAIAGGEVKITVGDYDRSRPLVIDPVLAFGTYLGGAGFDFPRAIAADALGAIYVAGDTDGFAGAGGSVDGFVVKLAADGTRAEWTVFLGGSAFDSLAGLHVLPDGSVIVAGESQSPDFLANPALTDTFVARLDPAGALVWLAQVGGSGDDVPYGLAVGPGGAPIYVVGYTSSTDLPGTAGRVQPAIAGVDDAFAVRLDGAGALAWATYLGGSGFDLAASAAVAGASGDLLLVGWTTSGDFPTTPGAFQPAVPPGPGGADLHGFAARLGAAGTTLGYATYLATGDGDTGANAVASDAAGNATIAGWTRSATFPVTPNAYQAASGNVFGAGLDTDAFLVQLGPTGLRTYATYLGGGLSDAPYSVAVGEGGIVHLVGDTWSTDFPVTPDAHQPESGSPGFDYDGFLLRLDPSLPAASQLVYGTYLGGSTSDSALAVGVDPYGDSVVAGITQSVDGIATPGVLQPTLASSGQIDDGFVMKLAEPPALASLAPASGTTLGGTTVVLSGARFRPNSTVTIGGTGAAVTAATPTVLTITTPPRPAGPAPVVVRNPDGLTSAPLAFTFVPPPTLTAVVPASGRTAGGDTVEVRGTAFQPGITVAFGGVACPVVAGSVTATALTCTTPARPAGPAAVVVTNPDGQSATLPAGFEFIAPPAVVAVSPDRGPLEGGTLVTVTGTGLRAGAAVQIGGAAATEITVLSATSLRARTPAGPAGPATVRVVNPDGQAGELAGGFTYVVGPAVAALAPDSGPTAGGTTVAISGSGFQAGATVAFGAVPAGAVTFVSATRLDVTSPASSAGSAQVVVTNPDGQVSNGMPFLFVPPPAVTSVAPASGRTSGGETVVIAGAGFASGATVSFGGVPAAAVAVDSPAQLTVTAPARAAGTVAVTVTNPDGQAGTLAGAYTFVPPPAVAQLAPAAGRAAGGDTVVITGAGFLAGATVTFGATPAAAVTVESATRITVTTPPGEAGAVPVVVTNPDGQASEGAAFSYGAPPAPGSSSSGCGCTTGGPSLDGMLGLAALALLGARRRRRPAGA